MANAIASQVQALYVGYLGRAADQAGLNFWTNAIANGTSTIESVALGFTLSQEYTSKYEGLSNEELAAAIYQNVLGRAADADGLAFWVGELEKGVQTPETLLAAMINSLGAVDQQTIDNKVYVANIYTATAGDAYNAEAGAQIIADVDATPASVSAALAQLEDGQLPGLIPGLGLYNAYVAATAAIEAYEAEVAATKADLFSDADLADDVIDSAEADAALLAAEGARTTVSPKSTNVLIAEAADTQAALNAAYAALSATGKQKADAYLAAVATAEATEGASAAAVAAEQARLDNDTTFDAALQAADAVVTGQTFADAATLYAFYTDAATSDADRATIDKAFAEVDSFAQFKAVALVDLADNKADAAVTAAQGEVTAETGGAAYLAALSADNTADGLVADAQEADALVAALQSIVDQFTALETTQTDALAALNQFDTDNANVVINIDSLVAADVAGGTAVNDVYILPGVAGLADTAVANFGTDGNDYILIGSEYSFNSGALTTGNNNALEFFVVQGATGAQLVFESVNYGSSTVTVDAAGTATASADATVITLTGVNAADVVVDNGIITVA
ncbi:DUF4214 domain-containing protein [Stutzerimonas stutzeri]|uniref:DUF4214 domain-containing protein n=1 Tax=Stutzerimonas stutzeri TaxID=316 RepID=A0AA42H414_STUST|nr:DUF4214 domain-containing protein [Stutzerimonas stutzeri]MDH0145298.1 DUF4214 domain-containing protein [Stutzerimonas stutzeri]MDH0150027.1 DUF4214 domain-containing protein [Stutzerimonas stutzeri]